jgi:hypothetical protein
VRLGGRACEGACNRRANHSPWARVLQSVVHIPGRLSVGICGLRPRYTCEMLWDGGKLAYASVSSHIKLQGSIQCTQGSRKMVRIHSLEGDRVSYVSGSDSHFDVIWTNDRALLSPSPSPGMVPNSRCPVLNFSAFRQARFQSTNFHFYQNRQLELYAAKEAQRLSLRQLVHDSC